MIDSHIGCKGKLDSHIYYKNDLSTSGPGGGLHLLETELSIYCMGSITSLTVELLNVDECVM